MTFQNPGYDLPIRLEATFSDGTSVSANESVRVSFASSDDRVALVDKRGQVSAVGVGNATIAATYDAEPVLRTTVAVTVESPSLSAVPSTLTFAPQPVGASASLAVALTNSRRAPVGLDNLSSFRLAWQA